MSNNLDPDQARHLVGPDLGPNCLQRSGSELFAKIWVQIVCKGYQQMTPVGKRFPLHGGISCRKKADENR